MFLLEQKWFYRIASGFLKFKGGVRKWRHAVYLIGEREVTELVHLLVRLGVEKKSDVLCHGLHRRQRLEAVAVQVRTRLRRRTWRRWARRWRRLRPIISTEVSKFQNFDALLVFEMASKTIFFNKNHFYFFPFRNEHFLWSEFIFYFQYLQILFPLLQQWWSMNCTHTLLLNIQGNDVQCEVTNSFF